MNHQDWNQIVFNNSKPKSLPILAKSKVSHNVSKSAKLDSGGDLPEIKKQKILYGKQITNMRIIKSWTQKEFARKLNIPENLLKQYEADKIEPTGQHKTLIQRVTGINFNQ
tara:strand:+ start:2352 stop:2684 length:333 start_codon:yes stop_codon:yes gene_type:complete